MDADVAVTVVAAAVAVVALTVAGGSVGDALDGGPNVTGDVEPREGGGVEEVPPAAGASGGGGDAGCIVCTSTGVRALVAGLVPSLSAPVTAAIALLGGLVLALAWRRAGGAAGEAGATAGDRSTGVEARCEGAAGSTASVEQPPAANPVYAAWRDVIERVEASEGIGAERREVLTPGEYAGLAREQDLEGDAVDALTALFERVRYGGVDVTSDRAGRAREVADRALSGDGAIQDDGERATGRANRPRPSEGVEGS